MSRHVVRSARICITSTARIFPVPKTPKIAARNAGYPGKRVSPGTTWPLSVCPYTPCCNQFDCQVQCRPASRPRHRPENRWNKPKRQTGQREPDKKCTMIPEHVQHDGNIRDRSIIGSIRPSAHREIGQRRSDNAPASIFRISTLSIAYPTAQSPITDLPDKPIQLTPRPVALRMRDHPMAKQIFHDPLQARWRRVAAYSTRLPSAARSSSFFSSTAHCKASRSRSFLQRGKASLPRSHRGRKRKGPREASPLHLGPRRPSSKIPQGAVANCSQLRRRSSRRILRSLGSRQLLFLARVRAPDRLTFSYLAPGPHSRRPPPGVRPRHKHYVRRDSEPRRSSRRQSGHALS